MFCLAFVSSGKRLVLLLIGGPVLFLLLASRRPSLVIFRKLQPFTKQNVCVQLQWAKTSVAGREKKRRPWSFANDDKLLASRGSASLCCSASTSHVNVIFDPIMSLQAGKELPD